MDLIRDESVSSKMSCNKQEFACKLGVHSKIGFHSLVQSISTIVLDPREGAEKDAGRIIRVSDSTR